MAGVLTSRGDMAVTALQPSPLPSTAATVSRVHPLFGARFGGVDMAGPLDDSTIETIRRAMDHYAVGIFPNAKPASDEVHIAFSRRFGPIQRTPVLTITGRQERIRHPEIIDQSNFDHEGNILPDNDKRLLYKRANQQWHTDMSFHPVRATYSLLSAHVIPPSGADTQFADMRAVWDALPQVMRNRIEGLEAEHSYWYSRVTAGGPEPDENERRSRPPARHRLVHVQPGTGRKVVYLASHASHIVGWPMDEGRALLDELMAFATRPEFVYSHVWSLGDVVMWDNLTTMHRATPFDDTVWPRDMRRTTVREAEV